ncbi:hypothetical protein GCM10027435_23980 [Haloparvum alkalitolerans]|uniref:hypothetical protein n=1 Tax=Haloparvum alkalitolerans TaxID=1042953 RepID=UPI003CEBDB32
MHVRDAVEADAEAVAALASRPVDAVRDAVHERSVRVAVRESDAGGGPPDDTSDPGDPTEPSDPAGYVAFDARPDAVHVTGFAGDPEAVERLLAEPVRFAEREKMLVEVVVEETANGQREAVERAGFSAVGSGPRFEGTPTVRYRLDPAASGSET